MRAGKQLDGDLMQIAKDDYADLIRLLASRESDFKEYSFIVNNKCLGEDALQSAEKVRRLSQGYSELLSSGGSPKPLFLRPVPKKPADFEENVGELSSSNQGKDLGSASQMSLVSRNEGCGSTPMLPASITVAAASSGTCHSNEAYNSDGSKENRSTERNTRLYPAAGRKLPDAEAASKPQPTLFGSIITSLNSVTSFIKDDRPRQETASLAPWKRENSSASSERKQPRVIELNRPSKPQSAPESRLNTDTSSRIPTMSNPIEIRSKANQGVPGAKESKSSAAPVAAGAPCPVAEKKPFLEALNMFRRKEVEGKKDADAELVAAMTSPRAVAVTATASPTLVAEPAASSQPQSGSVKDRIARLNSVEEPISTWQEPIVVDVDESPDVQTVPPSPRHDHHSGVLDEPLKPVHALVSAFQINAAPQPSPAPLPRTDSGSGSDAGPAHPPRPKSGAPTTSVVPFTKSYSLRGPSLAPPPPRTNASRAAPPGGRPAVPTFSANTAASKAKRRDGSSPVTSPGPSASSPRAAAPSALPNRGPPSGTAIAASASVATTTSARAGGAMAVKRSPRLLEKAKTMRVGAGN